MYKCKWHLCEKQTDKTYCSVKCKNKFNVTIKRKRLKTQALEYKGNKCEQCGYNRCREALEFHHNDPNEKEFALSQTGNTYSWERIQKELDKCALLCANCHRERHFLSSLI
jgi:hypothetical protein